MLSGKENAFLIEYLAAKSLELIELRSLQEAICSVYGQAQEPETLDILRDASDTIEQLIGQTETEYDRVPRAYREEKLWVHILDTADLLSESKRCLAGYRRLRADLRVKMVQSEMSGFGKGYFDFLDSTLKRSAIATGMIVLVVVALVVLMMFK